MPTHQIDFAALKEEIAIDRVIPMLGLPMARHGDQFRAACPTCKSGGPRALVVTVSAGKYYCFAAKRGGDVIALVAHVRGTGQKEAAQAISDQFQLGKQDGPIPRSPSSKASPEPTGRQVASPGVRAMEPLAYLDAHHDALQDLGVSPETLEHFGAGYASKGTMRGRLAVPIHTHDGTLVAYVGIGVTQDQQPWLLFHNFQPESFLFNLNRVAGDDGVYVARDPLEVLKAHENGVENVVSFLSPITANALQVLSLWMDERDIENVEIL